MKKLETNMIATRLSFQLYERLPDANRAHFMLTAPDDLAESVRKAVRAGHADAAKAIVAEAEGSVPEGATAGQWQHVIGPSVAALA